jgi:hypothetical protein
MTRLFALLCLIFAAKFAFPGRFRPITRLSRRTNQSWPLQFDVAVWVSIAPAQAVTARFGALLAQRIAAEDLSRIMAIALLATGIVMRHSSVTSRQCRRPLACWSLAPSMAEITLAALVRAWQTTMLATILLVAALTLSRVWASAVDPQELPVGFESAQYTVP